MTETTQMTPLQAIILGLVQGLTEFLPISSTAHLRIVPYFLGWDDPGAAFSAAIQLGTLAAVFVYFAGDVQRLTLAAIDGLRHRDLRRTPDTLLAWSIVPASIPIVVLGLGFKDSIENEARALWIIATALIVLALLLLLAERVSRRDRSLGQLTFWRIQIIGLCQALALVPGCSRSGSTIMGGLFVGLERAEAARFSFLLGLPAIGGAGLLKLLELLAAEPGADDLLNLALGIAAAAVSGYASIGLLLRFLQRHGTYAFSCYRIGLGAILLWTLY
ncbi:MAG TPA: undecaprenyl-diphosphatase UppP [Candidatus Latescibacteria bacterium]|nr:undecaprenyl-diphosphatase UppP [Candidatus Latescibacterota bacterium]